MSPVPVNRRDGARDRARHVSDDHPRHLDRDHRTSEDPGRTRLLADGAVLGAERLHADLRGLPAPRRPRRRHPRPPQGVRDRVGAVLRFVAPGRACVDAASDDRAPSRPGMRRRDPGAVHPRIAADPFSRRTRADPRDRLLRRHGWHRRGRRPRRRRLAGGLVELARRLLRQSADRAVAGCLRVPLPSGDRASAGAFDVAGATTSTLAMVALVYGLVRSAEDGWGDRFALLSLAAGVALTIAFVAIEARARQPIMPLRLFASDARSAAYGARLLFLGAWSGSGSTRPNCCRGVMGLGPAEAGLAFLPTTIVNFAAAMAVPRLTPRFGNARILAGGLSLAVLGMAWLAHLSSVQSTYLSLVLPMALIGAGQGGVLSPLTSPVWPVSPPRMPAPRRAWSTCSTSSAIPWGSRFWSSSSRRPAAPPIR